MLISEDWMDIKLLQKQGHSIRKIAELTGHSRNTVRRLLRHSAPQPFQKPSRDSQLDDFKPYIDKRFQECALSAVRLLSEIRPQGYKGGVDIIRRYLKTLRPLASSLSKATVRFETPPGFQSQCDWSYCGRFPDSAGNIIPIYCFVLVLSFSRYLFIDFTTSMALPIFIQCHLDAFSYFGGWTETILYDNLKQVRLNRDQFNPLMLDFASHYGLILKTHKPRRPRTKGKVERVIDYVKDNFLNGRVFADLSDLNLQGRNWLDTVANLRVHATTNQRPLDLFGAERLTSLSSIHPYRLALKEARKVSTEGFVSCKGSRYSVPPEQVGKIVMVEEGEQKIIIRSGDMIVAQHRKADKPGSTVAASQHLEAMWKMTVNRPGQALPHWEVTFKDSVSQARLEDYEEVEK